ncbi:acyl-CoA synthetase (AMP-forming)/AMP-acid ligase II [Saccharothrix carnea]|uniref:Acyl-CoA synthetase (AMP-forming)/AMP-acid ligase II n=1 Tax=Saccharothrix carnea TaxID=1280637 RepID=A0A2P8I0V4_SACCR|nr:acyl-CoA synthetase (AMP-forming)/AMP-acid ligase II [Saccharothrix carnea]
MPSAMLDLVTHGEAPPRSPAVHLVGGQTVSYGDLAALVGEAERSLRHDTKALVLCAGDRDLSTLLTYLAALRLGHTVAFLPASSEIVSKYQPEFVVPGPGGGSDLAALGYVPGEMVGGSHVFRRRSAQPAGDIFPDTALLLSTSGTTGSPKAVRLSYDGVADNAAAIVRVLGVTAAERAPTTLPITHAYGLSVVNSHLSAGASIVLTDRSPLSLALWDHVTRAGATSFAAVPTTYAAFGPAHLKLLEHTDIRTMTQSGARLGDELTMRLVRMMQRRQGRFFPMYGQTEATSRITCLDPDALPDRLGSVGTAVPGGVITIAPVEAHDRAAPGEGAVHYRGPGVMLGYATGRDDLGRGPEVDVLDTGDLGYLRDGYLYLTGRTKRIAKVLGVRTSLDDLERLVERSDHPSAVVCRDDVVYLFGAGGPDVHEQQRRRLAEALGVPSRHVAVRHVDRLPQTPGGKVDYRALTAAVDTQEVGPWI